MKRELMLTLTTDGERVRAIDVRLPRFDATALLAQKQASAAITLLPSVFSICAQAQAAAAAGATSAARGQPLSATRIAAHTLAVKIESVQESLRSLCLGLPETLLPRQSAQGAALIADFSQVWRDSTAFLARLQKALCSDVHDEASAFAALTQEAKPIAQAWDHFCARHVHGVSVLNWQGEENGASNDALPVMRWFRQMAEDVPTLGKTALSPLPLAMFRADKLSWRALVHAPYDASAWWRVEQDLRMEQVAAHFGNSAAARLWARLVDVARTLSGLLDTATEEGRPWIRIHSLGDGDGMAEVECARGVLVHRARLAAQNVIAYDLCAPTDWNLHRDGALATLIGLSATDVARLRTHATWLVQMLDPCVAFDIEVVHA
ncbi:MAG: hypothetical protein FWC38_06865 [Proteobacteria bacterium]|nr:hypothetical protein [Pseudomonadota bacterium]MCL2307924.1 hypothetical protein [Pseudomonadota bacterium]